MAKKIAVLICGSGYLDGSEIRESVGVLWALSGQGAEFQCFAPDDKQHDVVNCLNQKNTSESRNMLVESARIARSDVRPLSELEATEFDGLAIPGGFGVAKNLCSFAFDGSKAKIRLETKAVIEAFFTEKKPILAVCIAPALLAIALKDQAKLGMTLGAAGDASQEIEKLGHEHMVKSANEFAVDTENRIVSTPAYMYDDAKLHDIFTGIQGGTKAFLELA